MTNDTSQPVLAIRTAATSELGRAQEIARSSLDLDTEDSAAVPGYVWGEEKGTTRVRLLAYLGDKAVGVAIGSIQTGEAFLDLIAVVPDARRQGVGKQLLSAWEREATTRGAALLKVGENLRAYAWPGVDIRYTAAISLFWRTGYERTKAVYNMDLQLNADLAPNERQLARIATAGIVARRAELSDKAALSEHVTSRWNPTWERETLLGLEKNPPTVFLALRGDTIVGFAAHGVYRPSLYGPIATDPAEQGHGIGDVLSRLCLVDMATNGVTTGQIGWVAEDAIPFYSRTVGARLGRCLWMFQKSAA